MRTCRESPWQFTQRTVDPVTKIPVTVKVRTGWETDNVLPLLKRFEEIGVASIAIHGRTRSESYTGASDWVYIAQVKRELKIPVFGNGDVKTAADAIRMFETTARGQALGDAGEPAIPATQEFRQIVRGRLPFHIGTERENHFDFLPRRLDPPDQWRDAQILRRDPVEWRKFPAEAVVAAAEGARAFERQDIRRLLDDAEDPVIARRIVTHSAAGLRGEESAHRARPDRFLRG